MANNAGKVALTPKGNYDATATYTYLDFVLYNGSSYVAKETVSGILPTDNTKWQMLAAGSTGGGTGGGGAYIGQSTTEAATAGKVVATANSDFVLSDGAMVMVAFSETNTAANVTLNIDGTGAHAVRVKGAAMPSGAIKAGIMYGVIYDGNYYQMIGNSADAESYDGTQSGLSATTVQAAIDAIKTVLDNLSADAVDINYSNTASGATATNAQDAIDEAFAALGSVEDDLTDLDGTVTGLSGTVTGLSGTVSTLSGTVSGMEEDVSSNKANIVILNRRTRRALSSADLTALKTAIGTGEFSGLNIKDGDYFDGASGFRYTLGEFNHFHGARTQYSVINGNHYAIVVDCMATTPWNSANNCTGSYTGSTLRTYLRETALPKVKSDMAALGFNVISRNCLEANAFDTSAVNRWGKATGASSSWAWQAEEIIALSEPNVYGTVVAGSSFYDVGEANRQINCFKEYPFMDIFGEKYPWLKEPSASGYACRADGNAGSAAGHYGVTVAYAAFGLIVIS